MDLMSDELFRDAKLLVDASSRNVNKNLQVQLMKASLNVVDAQQALLGAQRSALQAGLHLHGENLAGYSKEATNSILQLESAKKSISHIIEDLNSPFKNLFNETGNKLAIEDSHFKMSLSGASGFHQTTWDFSASPVDMIVTKLKVLYKSITNEIDSLVELENAITDKLETATEVISSITRSLRQKTEAEEADSLSLSKDYSAAAAMWQMHLGKTRFELTPKNIRDTYAETFNVKVMNEPSTQPSSKFKLNQDHLNKMSSSQTGPKI